MELSFTFFGFIVQYLLIHLLIHKINQEFSDMCFFFPCRRAEQKDCILSTEQVNAMATPMVFDMVMKKEKPEPRGTRRKHSIVLEERSKLLKAAAHEQRQSKEVTPKKEAQLDSTCCKTASRQSTVAKKTCSCLDNVDCEHMNFQVWSLGSCKTAYIAGLALKETRLLETC